MIAAVVLAAGAATRMGRLKQLLPFRSGTLLSHAIEQARGANFEPVFVVIGAESGRVRAAVQELGVIVVENADWQIGQGSSIRAGITAVKGTQADAAAILLGDQPRVAATHLMQLAALLNEDCDAVAAEYAGTVGPPVLFKRHVFDTLKQISPTSGAKQVLKQMRFRRYLLPEAATDIDTPEDWKSFQAG